MIKTRFSLKFRTLAAAFLCTLVSFATPSAFAQQAQGQQQQAPNVDQAAVDALIKELPELNWIKICGVDKSNNKNVCTIRARELIVNNQVLGVIQLVAVDNQFQKLIMLLPTGLQIPDGVRVQVDTGEAIAGRFRICFPNNCVVEAPANAALIESMKKGGEVIVSAQNQAGRPIPFKFTLSGFTKAVDGEGIPAEVYAAAEQKMRSKAVANNTNDADLQKALQKRAQEAGQERQKQ